jgi:ubiquinone/menaquinone biosynthesis C-methylase UbiE
LLFGALVVGGLYFLGKSQRPERREALPDEMDAPALSEAWARIARLPQVRAAGMFVMHQALRGQRQARVLDIGSGAGHLSLLMAQQPQVADVIGIELSDALVQQARQSAEAQGAHAEFLQVDAAEMPFTDATFDCVVSTLSLHHWARPRKVLQEMLRVLKPGGQAFLFDLRRDAFPVIWGMMTLVSRFIVPSPLRETGEPLSSLKAAYTPWEAALLTAKAGWPDPQIKTGPLWMLVTLTKPVKSEE